MNVFYKLFSVLGLLLLLFTNLSSNSVHSAGELSNAFNFFEVKCLVADGGENDNVKTQIGIIRGCKQGDGISLLDRVIIFLYSITPALSVMVIAWGSYLYYNSSVSGDSAAGAKAIRAGVTGLGIVILIPVFVTFFNQLGDTTTFSFGNFASNITNILLLPLARAMTYIGGTFAVVSVVFAGYQYQLGDAKKGADALRNGLTGLAISLTAIMIVALITQSVSYLI